MVGVNGGRWGAGLGGLPYLTRLYCPACTEGSQIVNALINLTSRPAGALGLMGTWARARYAFLPVGSGQGCTTVRCPCYTWWRHVAGKQRGARGCGSARGRWRSRDLDTPGATVCTPLSVVAPGCTLRAPGIPMPVSASVAPVPGMSMPQFRLNFAVRCIIPVSLPTQVRATRDIGSCPNPVDAHAACLKIRCQYGCSRETFPVPPTS